MLLFAAASMFLIDMAGAIVFNVAAAYLFGVTTPLSHTTINATPGVHGKHVGLLLEYAEITRAAHNIKPYLSISVTDDRGVWFLGTTKFTKNRFLPAWSTYIPIDYIGENSIVTITMIDRYMFLPDKVFCTITTPVTDIGIGKRYSVRFESSHAHGTIHYTLLQHKTYYIIITYWNLYVIVIRNVDLVRRRTWFRVLGKISFIASICWMLYYIIDPFVFPWLLMLYA